MGYSTSYLGHVSIVPGLNQAEYDYLRAFSFSRRCYRDDGPYAVLPAHPWEGGGERNTDRYNTYADGQPGYWCQWRPCEHGCCLQYNGEEKFYGGAEWMQYLIDHFLRREAHARFSGDPQFRDFSFDHRMNGFLVGERRDTRELFAIIVRDDEVDRVVLRDGEPETPWDEGFTDRDDLPWLAPYPDPWLEMPSNRQVIERLRATEPALRSVPAGPTRSRPVAKKVAKPKPRAE